MNKVHAKRLLKLADFLATEVKPRQFDFGDFCRKEGCGTVACALGWAPVALPRLGVKLAEKRLESYGYEWEEIKPEIKGRAVSWERVSEHLFGTDHNLFDELFLTGPDTGDRPRTAKHLAKHIRKVVKRECPEVAQ